MNEAAYIRQMGQRLNAYWPHSDVGRPQLAAMHQTLIDVPLEQQLAALEALYRDGREHAPNGGQIRARLVDLSLDAPEWFEVKRALRKRDEVNLPQSSDCPDCEGSTWLLDEETGEARPCGCREERRRQARQARHPLVAAFLEQVGPDEVRDLGDRVAEAQVREKWLAFVRGRSEDDRLAGLPDAGLRRLTRVNGGPRQLGAALHVLRPGADPDAVEAA